LLLLVFGTYVRDSNIPFRLIRGPFLQALLRELPVSVFAPNVFLSVLAARAGENLWSIPVRHQDRMTGTVSIVRWKLITVCFRTARELVAFRLSLPQAIDRIASAGATRHESSR
jgi:dolichol-phosphate mannosyltransferase